MTLPARAPRWRRTMFRLGVVIGVGALVGGLVLAYAGYRATAGPAGAVKGYFAALARGDAPSALAFGNLPAGPHMLLTSTVLAEQRKIAPITHVHVSGTQRHGDSATVAVDYTIAFPGRPDRQSDKVEVVKRGSSWRLAQSAVRTRLEVVGASQRATVLGASLPSGDVLVFPGAAPVRLDTPYLVIDPPSSVITFASQATTSINAVVSRSGERQIKAAVVAALRSCLRAGADPRCPLPDGRAVPASLRGTMPAGVGDALTLSTGDDPAGQIEIRGTLHINGSYSLLDFDNVTTVKRGRLTVTLRAYAFAVPPLHVSWWREDAG